ncbi:hypothetical protein, partial [Pseudochelatococcus lubricantis]|uniref:hypothetical protein n=2 Tax=Pseudochelatococcus lubricantis TaxID=1538102 RepID=UPI001ABA08AD
RHRKPPAFPQLNQTQADLGRHRESRSPRLGISQLTPAERECCLSLPSAAMRGAFIDLSEETRSEVIELSQAEREATMASPDPRQALVERRYKEVYAENDVPWTHDTRPEIVDEDLRIVRAGFHGTVFSARIDAPDGKRDVVIKSLDGSVGWRAHLIGIGPSPHYELRNIASSLLARHLGFDVVVDTRLCLYKLSPRSVERRVGIMTELPRGQPAYDLPDAILENGAVRRELTKLQLVDAIAGQIDRHGGNMLIHYDGYRAVVRGVDNDQCFGKHPSDPDVLYQHHGSFGTAHDNGFHGVRLPGVIDTGMASAIAKLKPQDLRAMLSDKLQKEECDAAVARLHFVKAHVGRLASEQRIIEPDRWENPRSMHLFRMYCNATNSYGARELAIRSG